MVNVALGHFTPAQLERQRSLGLLSASLGHELKQPLTAILTNAQVARRLFAKTSSRR
jgi:C4-dicarboxylate-specific signal transduction histidine kinase